MRTTVEIPDPLLKRAKLAALEQGTTLRQLITRGPESVLRTGTEPRQRLTKPPVKLAADSPLRTFQMNPMLRTLPLMAAVSTLAAAAPDSMITIKQDADTVRIQTGGKPFTELLFGADRSKPVFYPVHGPGQIRMTRDFPFKKDTPGEKHDHPHHESLWYTHGDVNGVDFWSVAKRAGKIRQTGIRIENDTIRTTDDWLGPDGKRVCTDERTIKFSVLPGGARMIDFTITIKASDGELTFGDTKEGSMGIRTHPSLRVDKGASAVNSAGDKGKSVWGKAAKWVDYRGEIDGKPAGVAIFDHPTNPRHPSTWHARDYGLVAANPFGLSYFNKAKKGTGNMTVKTGENVSFRYAFLFHRGSGEKKPVEDLYQAWSRPQGH